MTTASADVPMKGLVPLLEAVAKVRIERDDVAPRRHRQAEGKQRRSPRSSSGSASPTPWSSCRASPTERIVELYAEAEVAVVPSLYEGFSLPAIEAMACGVPLVATTGGALPEVVGPDGEAGLLVPPNDPSALATAILRMLDDARAAGPHRRGRPRPGACGPLHVAQDRRRA